MVTNSLTFLSKVDKIVVLKDGTISEMGSYKELLSTNGAFSELISQYLAQPESDGSDSDPKCEFDTPILQ